LIASGAIRFSGGNNSYKLQDVLKGANQLSHLRIGQGSESVESVLSQIESEVNAFELKLAA